MALTRVLPIEADSYANNALHSADRLWLETNCYTDLWIEVLHALGLDPVPALAFLFSTDFDGDQWRFFKFPTGDLRHLYGLEVFEMNPWQGVEHHVEEQLRAGRLTTVEMDSYYLPDTAGLTHRIAHVKTTITPNMIDREAMRMGYFHNDSYYELEGDDYAGVFRHHLRDQPEVLVPYMELVRLERMGMPGPDELRRRSLDLVASHVRRRPVENPVAAMRKRIEGDLDWLAAGDLEQFHAYAFPTVRQCGAALELTASFCSWLHEQGEPTGDAAEHFLAVSAGMKTVQFKLARLVAGRSVDLSALLDELVERHATATSILAETYDP